MRISQSIAEAYDSAHSVAIELQATAGSRLRILCIEHSWLFDDRIKSIESCLSKLDAGDGPLSEVKDLYAATVVVPTQSELDEATEAILGRVTGHLKPSRTASADTFVYDDIHVIARLEGVVSPRSVSAAALVKDFEVQVRTGLQYAWWRATHDQVYKSPDIQAQSWEMQRTSGQARASLELLDGVLSNLATASALQRPTPTPSVYRDEPRKWLALWPRQDAPRDLHRFTATVNRLLERSGASYDDVRSRLGDADFSDVIGSPEISPVQAVVIALADLDGDRLVEGLRDADARVLITAEMRAIRPHIRLDPRVTYDP